MKQSPRLLSLCLSSLLVLASAAGAEDAKKYTLKLERPDKAGDKSHEVIKATLEKSNRATRNRKAIKDEKSYTDVVLTGTQEVVEVNDKGDIRKLKFTVEKFTTQEENESEVEALKPGTVVTGTSVAGKEGDKYEVDGKPVEEKTAKVLREMLTLNGSDKKPSDDDLLFGNPDPVAPGAEWEVHKQAVKESISEDSPLKLAEDGISGKVKFLDVKTQDGAEACRVKVNMEVKLDSVDGLPPPFRPTRMFTRISGEKLAPVDPARIIPFERLDHVMDVAGVVPAQGGAVELTIFYRKVRERTSTPVK